MLLTAVPQTLGFGQEPTEENVSAPKILMHPEGMTALDSACICQKPSIFPLVTSSDLHRNPLSEQSRPCPPCTDEKVSAGWSKLSKVTPLCVTAAQISLLSDKPMILPDSEDALLAIAQPGGDGRGSALIIHPFNPSETRSLHL